MSKKNDFPLPEMPGVCLTCGARGPLTPTKFVFKHMSKTSAVITILALFAGVLYTRQMVYRLQLPVCGLCLSSVRRAKHVAILGFALFLPASVVSMVLSTFFEIFILTPVVYIIAALVYYMVVRGRGTPKTARVDNDHLILSVPGYGEFVLFERTPSGVRRDAKPRAAQAPRLNRSVCAGCGFINFPGVAECKKCRSPLGQTVAA